MNINVISLFDGMSCGQQALERVNIKVDKYYASEIDKHAIKVTMANYPNTIQLGDVRALDISNLSKIDLIIGGSPCQSFSFAGKRNGMTTKSEIEILTLEHYLELKSQNFEFEGQSYLFWEYMRVLKEIQKYNPNVYFLLENVMMADKWQKVLTRAIGINPICINSSLVSAQNRERLYWTNIGAEPDGLFGDMTCKIPQPKNKGLLLKDVLEQQVDQKYFLSDNMLKYFKTRAANFNNGKINIRNENQKATTITASSSSVDISDNFVIDKSKERKIIHEGNFYDQNTRWGVYNKEGISPTITASMGMGGGHIPMVFQKEDVSNIRKLTPIECERLQTVPVNEKNITLELCLDQAKNLVNAVSQNLKWRRLVSIVEKGELSGYVKSVIESMSANNQSKSTTVLTNAGMPTQKQTNECTNHNPEEQNSGVNAAEKRTMFRNQDIGEDSAIENVSINITEGQITRFGREALLQNDKTSIIQKNGKSLLKLSGNEIVQLVEDVEIYSATEKTRSSIYTILSPLSTNSIEQVLIIYFLFAKAVTDGFIPGTTSIKNLSLNFSISEGYTNHVSDTQRYKMLGNGWTISVISHIFSYLPFNKI